MPAFSSSVIETMSNSAVDSQGFASQLHRLIAAVDASGRMLLPNTMHEMLQSIVDACASLINAAGVSILLADEAAEELVFKAARSAGEVDIVGLRIPATSGIAGFVYMTGQPIAVSDVQRDARFNQSFAQSVGYIPQSILATPMMMHDRVIGVMGNSHFHVEVFDLLMRYGGACIEQQLHEL